jgi:GNAT superfamily N-acetyltransferase
MNISDLRQQPAFRDHVADRIWRNWWKERGTPLAALQDWVAESLSPGAMPFALVAHDGEVFAGTASVIASDLAERPQYTPWVAAMWVEPQFRGQRIARALVARAVNDAFACGVPRGELCARESLDGFYAGQGFVPIERGVGPRQLTVFTRDAGHGPAAGP